MIYNDYNFGSHESQLEKAGYDDAINEQEPDCEFPNGTEEYNAYYTGYKRGERDGGGCC